MLVLVMFKKRELFLKVIIGLLIALLPNAIFFLEDSTLFLRMLNKAGNIGGHSSSIDPFHMFHVVDYFFPKFGDLYLKSSLWLIASLSGLGLAVLLFIFNKLTIVQSLAITYTTVCLFAPEPFRIEPLLVLFWINALGRNDRLLQLITMLLTFGLLATWFPYIKPSYFAWNEIVDKKWFGLGGLLLGFLIIVALVRIIVHKRVPTEEQHALLEYRKH